IRAIDELLSYIKRHPGIWFATSAEVAEWWLERGKI
ncbi:MAG: allantoinase, partial [Candidatus Tectomicrobia bacterium]|nr:allantoinase [Candidatus Tectomicrobia bacterium]